MKRKTRRYREKTANLFVAAQIGHRIHDFLKGWGTIDKDGSVLWDHWRPPTKRQAEKARKRHEKFMKNPILKIPMIKDYTFPTLTAEDIVGTQPILRKLK